MVSLIIPWGLLLLLVVVIILLIKKKWLWSTILVILIAILNSWSDCFCFGFKNSNSGDFKILSFNVNGEGVYEENKAQRIVQIIEKENPDFLFLTELFNPFCDSLGHCLNLLYPYDTKKKMGHNVVYSKYPISGIRYFDRIFDGSSYVVECSITIKGRELTIYGCHLSSNNYSKDLDYLTPGKVTTLSGLCRYLSNVTEASQLRVMEVDSLLKRSSTKGNVVFVGDMNDVSGSPSMRKFKREGFKDAWSEGGFGYGATIHHPLPYRIDHILYNEKLVLKGIKKIDSSEISDHDALVAVFDLIND